MTMYPHRLTAKACLRSALALTLAAGVLVFTAPARAEDDDVPLDTKIFRNLMSSLGLKRADEAPIVYEERPPLVLPPDQSLPPPQTSDPALKNPAWPKDPDVARAKMLREMESQVSTSEQIRRDSYPLRPDQMTPGKKYAPRLRRQTLADPAGVEGERLSQKELGYSGGLFSKLFGKGDEKEAARFTGEPPRASLTDPPAGYQTPSPDQPYGTGKAPSPKAVDSYNTHGEATKNDNF